VSLLSQNPWSGATSAHQTARQRESDYFDTRVEAEGDFNPFAERGWDTLARRFREMVPLTAPVCLLDVGCGTGQSRRLYLDGCWRYVAVDLSLGALRKAAGRFPASAWIRSDAAQLPFADRQFDVVAFSSVLHHIENFALPVREGLRVLRPGGYAFAFDPNLHHPAMALFRCPRSLTYTPKGVSPNERPLAPGQLRRVFETSGFEAVRQRCQADIPYRAVTPKPLNALLGAYNACDRLIELCGLGRWLGTFVITVGRKPQ
jgi:ubiquinone/menaquinone biosynthesis C-methylase UbiE